MSSLIESLEKGPAMTMTLESTTEFPKALENLMLSFELEGPAVYKGFPWMENGQELWWMQLHLYKNKGDDQNKTGYMMFTNSESQYASFMESARSAAWAAIDEMGERLKYRVLNTQKDLKDAYEEIEALKANKESLLKNESSKKRHI